MFQYSSWPIPVDYPLAALSIQGRRDGKTDLLGRQFFGTSDGKRRSRFWDDGARDGEVSCDGPSGHRPEWIFGSSLCSCFLGLGPEPQKFWCYGNIPRIPKVVVAWKSATCIPQEPSIFPGSQPMLLDLLTLVTSCPHSVSVPWYKGRPTLGAPEEKMKRCRLFSAQSPVFSFRGIVP